MITIGGTNIVKAYLGSTELTNIAIGDELLLSSEPIEYLAFEDQRMWEIIAYTYGDVVDMRGKEIANGTLEGNGNTEVTSDYVYVDARVIPAHLDAKGETISQRAARVVSYRIELEVVGGSGTDVPWNIDSSTASTSDTVIFQIKETTGFTTSTRPSATTFANVLSDGNTGWGEQNILIKDGNKWYADFSATANTEYLQVAIRAADGVVIQWKLIPLATSTNACWQPVGITLAQCEAVTTFGNSNSSIQRFRANTLLQKFNEFRYFTGITNLWGNHNGGRYAGFNACINLKEITFPDSLITLGEDALNNCAVTRLDFKNIETIGYCCFNNYQVSMHSLIFNKVTTIGNNNNFRSRTYKYVDFSELMTNIPGQILFIANSVVVCRSTTPPTVANVSNNTPKALYVPSSALESYKTTSPWSSYASVIYPIEGTWYETHRSLDPNDN